MRKRKSYKFKCRLSIGFAGVDRDDILDLVEDMSYTIEELNAMSENELEQVINEAVKEWAWEYIEFGGVLINE
jgi:hypothetical protein